MQAKVVPMYRQPWVLSVAASLLLLVALTYYVTREQTPLNEKLYTAYFEPFDSPGSGLTRNSEVTLKQKLTKLTIMGITRWLPSYLSR